ncbi:MAG: AbrB/MazE/SpoVT family DNA-binding domain-containing protein [Nitrosarchaeum sp.]|nr:AbrB/MazE/SpoVT family DNA-binding domain-containing protein [Nitrosarchaeum sp.]
MEKPIFGVGTVYKANGNDSLALIIPKAIKDGLGIEKGARFLISAENGTITLKLE